MPNLRFSSHRLLIIFSLVAILWYMLARFLSIGNTRNVLVVIFTFIFCGVFLLSLFNSLRRLYGDIGGLWTELGMSFMNVFIFLLGFSAVYHEVGVIDTSHSQTEITKDFWACCYYSIITFTSTGYGDIIPIGITRVLACLQVLIGYLVLGIMASTSLSVVQWTAKGSGVNRGEAQEQGSAEDLIED